MNVNKNKNNNDFLVLSVPNSKCLTSSLNFDEILYFQFSPKMTDLSFFLHLFQYCNKER